ISFAMVTPSLHTMGTPQDFWISTDLDFGPRVMRTAAASRVAPRRTFSRAAEWNNTCLCAMAFTCVSGACGMLQGGQRRSNAGIYVWIVQDATRTLCSSHRG